MCPLYPWRAVAITVLFVPIIVRPGAFRHRLGGDEVGPVAPILEEVIARAADPGITGPDGCPASHGQGVRGPLAARLHATDDIRATESRDDGVGKLTKTGNALILEFVRQLRHCFGTRVSRTSQQPCYYYPTPTTSPCDVPFLVPMVVGC